MTQKAYLLFTKLLIRPDFPSLADEIAEPHQDMNIKVAAFTVSEKSSNTSIIELFALCKGGNFNIHIWAWFGNFICGTREIRFYL